MGQKVNPIGLRIGYTKDWRSRWFANKKEFAGKLAEELKSVSLSKVDLKNSQYRELISSVLLTVYVWLFTQLVPVLLSVAKVLK